GETLVESYTITDMAHGTPLGTADNDEQYGAQGAFLIEAGISSSYHIANFFGLTEWIRQPKETARETVKENARETRKASIGGSGEAGRGDHSRHRSGARIHAGSRQGAVATGHTQ